MVDISNKQNEDLLTPGDDDLAVDADDTAYYDPNDTESQVVVTEPPIISIGRAKRAAALRKMQQEKR